MKVIQTILMKDKRINTFGKCLCVLSFLLFMAIHSSYAQPTVEVYGAVGSTVVDAKKLAGVPLADWDTFASGYSIQAFLWENEYVSVGAEYGYTYLLFYTFLVGQSFFEQEVEASRAMVMARGFPDKNYLLEIGTGAYFFDGTTEPAIGLGVGYKFGLGKKVFIPLKLRADLIFTENTPMTPLTINSGLAFKF